MRDADCRPRSVSKRDYSGEAELFKVLADPHRLKIFATIASAEDEVCVCDLTAGVPLEQPTVSHHLRVLREAGLLQSERRGTWVYYRLTAGALERLKGVVESLEHPRSSKSLRRTG